MQVPVRRPQALGSGARFGSHFMFLGCDCVRRRCPLALAVSRYPSDNVAVLRLHWLGHWQGDGTVNFKSGARVEAVLHRQWHWYWHHGDPFSDSLY